MAKHLRDKVRDEMRAKWAKPGEASTECGEIVDGKATTDDPQRCQCIPCLRAWGASAAGRAAALAKDWSTERMMRSFFQSAAEDLGKRNSDLSKEVQELTHRLARVQSN